MKKNESESLSNKDKNFEKIVSENQKLKKSKKYWIIVTTVLLIITLLCIIASTYVYFRKTYKILEYRYAKEVKNGIINKFMQNDEFVENYHNSNYPLKLESAYGDNDATHPKILNFSDKWHGYKYWMVYSPYPHSDDSKENPHLKVSNDLINWTVPDGFSNPIDDTPSDYEAMKVYYSDPHLVYNNDKDELECYYRKVDDNKDEIILYRKISKDGVKWSKKETVLRTKKSKKDYISPAIIYDNGVYKIWYVDKNNVVCYAESNDGYNYNSCKKINLKYPINVKTWHLDVIKTEKGYEMITVAYYDWNDRSSMNLYYFKSQDETNFLDGMIIIKPSQVSWDNQGLYRSSFIYENGIYYVFYSGISTNFDRGIGLSYGEHIENLVGSNLKK